jgi:hypothetical protein
VRAQEYPAFRSSSINTLPSLLEEKLEGTGNETKGVTKKTDEEQNENM